MPDYRCTIRSSDGSQRKVTITAESPAAAREILDGRGYAIIKIARKSNRGAGRALGLLLVVGIVAFLGYVAYQNAPQGGKGLLVSGTVTGTDVIRLVVVVGNERFEVDPFKLEQGGHFRRWIHTQREQWPATCDVTVGASGCLPVAHKGVTLSGDPPVCMLPTTRMQTIDDPTSPSPSPIAANTPVPSSPTPRPDVSPEAGASPTTTPAPTSTPTPTTATTPTPVASPEAPATPAVEATPEASPTPDEADKSWNERKWTATPGVGLQGVLEIGQTSLPEALPAPSEQSNELWLWQAENGAIAAILEDGAVSRIRLVGLRVVTERNLYNGAPASKLRELYPEAEKEPTLKAGRSEFVTSGITFEVQGKTMQAMSIVGPSVDGWRFMRLKVEPGIGAGPLKLREPISPLALEQFGPISEEAKLPPDLKRVRWGQPPDRFIEVLVQQRGSNQKIMSIRLRGVKAYTDRGIALGVDADKVKRVYAEGREGLSDSFDTEVWKADGLELRMEKGVLVEFKAY